MVFFFLKHVTYLLTYKPSLPPQPILNWQPLQCFMKWLVTCIPFCVLFPVSSMPLSLTNNRLWFWRGDKNISIACVFLSWQLMWKDLWDCRPVRSGHDSAWRFIALKHFKIKTAILVIWRLLFISLYCVRVMQCAQGWRTTSVFSTQRTPYLLPGAFLHIAGLC